MQQASYGESVGWNSYDGDRVLVTDYVGYPYLIDQKYYSDVFNSKIPIGANASITRALLSLDGQSNYGLTLLKEETVAVYSALAYFQVDE
jgi:hypothetical protein